MSENSENEEPPIFSDVFALVVMYIGRADGRLRLHGGAAQERGKEA